MFWDERAFQRTHLPPPFNNSVFQPVGQDVTQFIIDRAFSESKTAARKMNLSRTIEQHHTMIRYIFLPLFFCLNTPIYCDLLGRFSATVKSSHVPKLCWIFIWLDTFSYSFVKEIYVVQQEDNSNSYFNLFFFICTDKSRFRIILIHYFYF